MRRLYGYPLGSFVRKAAMRRDFAAAAQFVRRHANHPATRLAIEQIEGAFFAPLKAGRALVGGAVWGRLMAHQVTPQEVLACALACLLYQRRVPERFPNVLSERLHVGHHVARLAPLPTQPRKGDPRLGMSGKRHSTVSPPPAQVLAIGNAVWDLVGPYCLGAHRHLTRTQREDREKRDALLTALAEPFET